MKNFLFLTLLISIYAVVPAGYKLIWSDEFEGSSIDGTKWGYDIGGGWGNNELEYYTNRGQNAYVSDGKLHIKTIKENYEGKKYTSARMLTKGKENLNFNMDM